MTTEKFTHTEEFKNAVVKTISEMTLVVSAYNNGFGGPEIKVELKHNENTILEAKDTVPKAKYYQDW